jgi:hypothetical protein
VEHFDTPKTLLDNPKSLFSELVEATGPEQADFIRRVANGTVNFVDTLAADSLSVESETKPDDAVDAETLAVSI